MGNLTVDEILAMQLAGVQASEIMSSKLTADTVDDSYDQYGDEACDILDRQEDAGVVSLTFQDANFPKSLKRLGADCPPLIHCLGNRSLMGDESKCVAIIGARGCTKDGFRKARELGERFASEGNVIISGLALGCDKAAHEGCLDAGGKTIAIVGSGLDIIFPSENVGLQKRILENGGLIVSEQHFGIKASGKTLVARNRLQAGLSRAVILAECPAHSGSLHTMRFARKYHRESLAAIFPVWNKDNEGNHNLIKDKFAKPIS